MEITNTQRKGRDMSACVTPEQRKLNLEKAKETIRAKQEVSKRWKHDWVDAPLWAHLRSKLGIRAIPSYIHCSELKHIRRTLRETGKDTDWWKEHFFDVTSATESLLLFSKQNPNVPMYALQGIMLEATYPALVKEFRNTDS